MNRLRRQQSIFERSFDRRSKVAARRLCAAKRSTLSIVCIRSQTKTRLRHRIARKWSIQTCSSGNASINSNQAVEQLKHNDPSRPHECPSTA